LKAVSHNSESIYNQLLLLLSKEQNCVGSIVLRKNGMLEGLLFTTKDFKSQLYTAQVEDKGLNDLQIEWVDEFEVEEKVSANWNEDFTGNDNWLYYQIICKY